MRSWNKIRIINQVNIGDSSGGILPELSHLGIINYNKYFV